MTYEEAITIGFSAVTFMMFYLSTKARLSVKLMGKRSMEIELLQPLFLIVGFIFMMFNVELMVLLADIAGQAGIAGLLRIAYKALVWPIFPLLIFFLVISFIYNLFRSFSGKSASR